MALQTRINAQQGGTSSLSSASTKSNSSYSFIPNNAQYQFPDLHTLFGQEECDIAGRLWTAGVLPIQSVDGKRIVYGKDLRETMETYARRVTSLTVLRQKSKLKESTFNRFTGVKTDDGMIWGYVENIARDDRNPLYAFRKETAEEAFFHELSDMVAHAPFRMKDLARKIGIQPNEMDRYFPSEIRDEYVTKLRGTNQYRLNKGVSLSVLEQVVLENKRNEEAADRERNQGQQAIRRIVFLPDRYPDNKAYALKCEFHSLAYPILEQSAYKDERAAMEIKMMDNILAIIASAISRSEAQAIRQRVAEKYQLEPSKVLDDDALPGKKQALKTREVTLDSLCSRYHLPEDKLAHILQGEIQETYLSQKEGSEGEKDGRWIINEGFSEADLVDAVFEAYEREATRAMLKATDERIFSKNRLTFRKARFAKNAVLHAKIEFYTNAWPYAMARKGHDQMNKLENAMLDCVVQALFETLPQGKGLRIFARLEKKYGVTLNYAFVRRDLLRNNGGKQTGKPADGSQQEQKAKKETRLQVNNDRHADENSEDGEDDEDYSDELASIDAILGNDDKDNDKEKDEDDKKGDEEDEDEYYDDLDDIDDPFNK